MKNHPQKIDLEIDKLVVPSSHGFDLLAFDDYCSEIDGNHFATTYLLLTNAGKENQRLYSYRVSGPININSGLNSKMRRPFVISTHPNHLTRLEEFEDFQVAALTSTGLYKLRNEC